MVQAWIYDTASTASPQNPHFTSPIRPVSLPTLASLGVLYWRLSTIGAVENPLEGELGAIRKERGYGGHDVVNLSPNMNGYAEKLKIFFQEHLHEDEEIRFCVDGSGYFDVRSDVSDEWIRIHVTRGDMIVLPAGMYHRFITDDKDFMQAMRLFKDAPRWEAINRGEKADQTAARAEYSKFIQGAKEELEQKEKEKLSRSNNTQNNESADTLSSSSSSFLSSVSDIRISSHSGVNGDSFILEDSAASSLANYPHLRAYGGLLFVSGISSRRPDNTHAGATRLSDGTWKLDIAEQTAAVLDNIGTILLSAGSNLEDVVDINVYLTDMSSYGEFNKTYNKYFPVPERAPTRTTVAVKQLPHPNLLIEIKAVAVDRRNRK